MYIKSEFLECAHCTQSLNQKMGYQKISWDLKEHAIFLLDRPEICDNICKVLGISPASLNCQILLSTMITPQSHDFRASQALPAQLDLPPERGSIHIHSIHNAPSTVMHPSEWDFWWIGSFYVLYNSKKI